MVNVSACQGIQTVFFNLTTVGRRETCTELNSSILCAYWCFPAVVPWWLIIIQSVFCPVLLFRTHYFGAYVLMLLIWPSVGSLIWPEAWCSSKGCKVAFVSSALSLPSFQECQVSTTHPQHVQLSTPLRGLWPPSGIRRNTSSGC